MIKKKGILNDLSYAVVAQQAFTYACIFVLVNEFEETMDFLLVGFYFRKLGDLRTSWRGRGNPRTFCHRRGNPRVC